MDKLNKILEVEQILNNAVSYKAMAKWNRLTESAKLDAIQGVSIQELVTYLQKRG